MDYIYTYKPREKTKILVRKASIEIVDAIEKAGDWVRKERNQTSTEKHYDDQTIGGLGEICVWVNFKDNNEIFFPDFKVHKKRSHKRDLKLNNTYGLHVKNQHIDSANRYGVSWAVQSKNILVGKPSSLEIFALCLYDDNHVHLIKLIRSTDIVYGEPKLAKLWGDKKFIYWEYIKDKPNFDIYNLK